MTNDTLESKLRARSLRGISPQARRRLLAEIDSMKIDIPLVPAPKEFRSGRPLVAICICAGIPVVLVVATVLWISNLRAPGDNEQTVASKNVAPDQPGSMHEGIATKGSRDTIPQIQRRENLQRKSLDKSVAEAEVIVVARGLKFEAAPPKQLGDGLENYITLSVSEVLKGEFKNATVVIRTPTNPNEFIDKEWVVMLSPEFIKEKHSFAGVWTIKLLPRIRKILDENEGD